MYERVRPVGVGRKGHSPEQRLVRRGERLRHHRRDVHDFRVLRADELLGHLEHVLHGVHRISSQFEHLPRRRLVLHDGLDGEPHVVHKHRLVLGPAVVVERDKGKLARVLGEDVQQTILRPDQLRGLDDGGVGKGGFDRLVAHRLGAVVLGG